MLAPGLRVAYAILPRPLVGPIEAAQRRLGAFVPTHVQAALADFLRDGHLRAQVRRMAAIYQDNARALADALRRQCRASLAVAEPRGGLQLAAWFRRADVDDRAVAAALGVRGFGPRPLSDYTLAAGRPGLLFGVAKAEPGQVASLARHLEALLAGPALRNGLRS